MDPQRHLWLEHSYRSMDSMLCVLAHTMYTQKSNGKYRQIEIKYKLHGYTQDKSNPLKLHQRERAQI